jgi:hypothetical protein
MQTAKHTALHDLKRDWESWNLWEQRAVKALAVVSVVASLFWLGMSLQLVL